MNQNFYARHWYADVYEQFETQTDDVDFLLEVLKSIDRPESILEVACGGGRICVPLAQAGYNVTGFDSDEYMLLRCVKKAKGLPNLHIYQADALKENWGKHDAIIIAGNFLINIEGDMDYKAAQRMLFAKASEALGTGGWLYLDFDLYANPRTIFTSTGESYYFDGTDELGTTGRTVSCGSVYDGATQICAGCSHLELRTASGEKIIIPRNWYKHIPTLPQVFTWLDEAGFNIFKTYRNYSAEPLPDSPDDKLWRASILARKR